MVTPKKSLFRTAALVSHLLTRDQLDRAEAALRLGTLDQTATAIEISDAQLAKKLVEMGLLTPYQAEQLQEGRSKLNLGPYIITDFIGQGGMGQVFKATHRIMGRETAVKVLPLSKSTPETIANFNHEVRMQAQLDHPNLVHAYDAGHDGNVHYLVTEFVPGTDLRRLVRSQGPLSMQQAASIIMQAARGLEYAHRRGLVHRDVKPGNILVTHRGVAKVSDLGLAGFVHKPDEDPRAGKIVGTADYISPEHFKNPHDVNAVSDIYSLGCTLYYAVTGKVPFPGGTKGSKARRHCEETPWHPRRFNPEVSEEFVEVIADMMEKDPNLRVQSAAEVALRLEPWAKEVSLVPSQQLTKSPWLPPPPPTGREEDPLQDTDISDYPAENDSPSHMSQVTDPIASSAQETLPVVSSHASPPPLTLDGGEGPSRDRTLAIALAIAIPISMLAGAALTLVLLSIF